MLPIDKFSRTPIYEQIIHGIEREIMAGTMKAGEQIPSLRELSSVLGVNPNTMQKAYAELARRGLILASQGSGYFVSDQAPNIIRTAKEESVIQLEPILRELAKAGVKRTKIEALLDRIYSEQSDFMEEKS